MFCSSSTGTSKLFSVENVPDERIGVKMACFALGEKQRVEAHELTTVTAQSMLLYGDPQLAISQSRRVPDSEAHAIFYCGVCAFTLSDKSVVF